jgi:two-component system, NtrC family, response regulator AtoC
MGRATANARAGVSGHVLVIDDDPLVRRSIRRVLTTLGYEVSEAEDGESGLDMLSALQPDVALVDVRMPGIGGIEVLSRAKVTAPGTDCIVVTGHGDVEIASQSLLAGASDYFEKPIHDWQRFQQVLRRAVEIARLRRENQRLRDDDEELLFGPSEEMQALRERVRQVAASTATALVLGESGSGKDLVAKVIHRRSGRTGPYVPANCGGISVLDGLFREADDGTLFLDEIGDLPIDLQGHLLRAIEQRTYRLTGGEERPLTARIVAATHKDLRTEAAEGRFRTDLLFRIDVLRVEVPPLRLRVGDIVPLVYRFIDEFNHTETRAVRRVSPEALRLLEQWTWPGNVRELRNVLHNAVVMCHGEEVGTDDLRGIGQGSTLRRTPSPAGGPREAAGPFGALLELKYAEAKERAVEWFTDAYLQYHLASTDGNITQAAERAGMARPNFSRLMRRFGIEPQKGLSEALGAVDVAAEDGGHGAG